MNDLPRWMMGDPAKVYEQIEEGRRKRARRELKVDPFGAIWRKGAVVMTRDESEQIEELLLTWYYWADAHREQLGYRRVSPGFQYADSTEVHEDDDDRDARLNRYVAEQVDACLLALPVDLRAAVGIHTANRAAGNEVYRNPRCTPEEQHRRYQEAKLQMLPLLRRRDLIKIAA